MRSYDTVIMFCAIALHCPRISLAKKGPFLTQVAILMLGPAARLVPWFFATKMEHLSMVSCCIYGMCSHCQNGWTRKDAPLTQWSGSRRWIERRVEMHRRVGLFSAMVAEEWRKPTTALILIVNPAGPRPPQKQNRQREFVCERKERLEFVENKPLSGGISPLFKRNTPFSDTSSVLLLLPTSTSPWIPLKER